MKLVCVNLDSCNLKFRSNQIGITAKEYFKELNDIDKESQDLDPSFYSKYVSHRLNSIQLEIKNNQCILEAENNYPSDHVIYITSYGNRHLDIIIKHLPRKEIYPKKNLSFEEFSREFYENGKYEELILLSN